MQIRETFEKIRRGAEKYKNPRNSKLGASRNLKLNSTVTLPVARSEKPNKRSEKETIPLAKQNASVPYYTECTYELVKQAAV